MAVTNQYWVSGIAVACDDSDQAVGLWESLLGAQQVNSWPEPALGAQRTQLRLGNGSVDVLSPLGDGYVQRALDRRGPHIFATLVASGTGREATPERTVDHGCELENSDLYLPPALLGMGDIGLIVQTGEPLPPTGVVGQWFESTMLVDDPHAQAITLADTLGLEPSLFRTINSPEFGYDGILTMFRHGELSRLEVVLPWEHQSSTMRRFFDKWGSCIYMAFAECTTIHAVRDELTRLGYPPVELRKEGRLQQIFVPPVALSGVMLGLAYPDEAWNWSRGECVFSDEGES